MKYRLIPHPSDANSKLFKLERMELVRDLFRKRERWVYEGLVPEQHVEAIVKHLETPPRYVSSVE